MLLSGLTIYDSLRDNPELFIDDKTLESILNQGLQGYNLNYPIRTRSKVVKSKICNILGYPIPKTFRRTKPRFIGQNFDVSVQQANNFQLWNQDIDLLRRFVFIRVNNHNIVSKVKVVSGETLAKFDTTGTITGKYQAKSIKPVVDSCLVSDIDTLNTLQNYKEFSNFLFIKDLYNKLLPLIGSVIINPGINQERNRSGELHKEIAKIINKGIFHDTGQFPDIIDQLLEIKLQTSPTIDLGLVNPCGDNFILNKPMLRYQDVRYAVFYGIIKDTFIKLEKLIIVTGLDFFKFFQRFEGNIINKKLQMHLPVDFFN